MGKITFKINGKEYSVRDGDVSSDMSLVDFLRKRLELRGTKYMCREPAEPASSLLSPALVVHLNLSTLYMCREGGCGACIVSAVTSPGGTPKAVNSCLMSITQCHGWEITTIEKVGNKRDGYHPIQKTLANKHGTQCGHCSPGWVMAMYSLAQSKPKLTQLEIENSFGSNICRCTGYRSIMDAMKTFADDAPKSQITDIEDLRLCKKTNKPCNNTCGSGDDNDDDEEWCIISNLNIKAEAPIEVELADGKKWYKVSEVQQIFDILSTIGGEDYMLVSGNTSKGAYPIDEYPNILIDVREVTELRGHVIDQNLNVGANNTLTEFLDILETTAQETNFEYLQKIHDHIVLVAHIPVRNMGSIAGNLMTKHKHHEFYSDIFLLLETVGAYLTINSSGTKQKVSMQDFLKMDMDKKIVYNVMLPPLSKENLLVTFKVMPRAQSSVAIVNSGFLYKMQQSDNTVLNARIVIGGLSPDFIRATKTEEYLKGKKLFSNETLQGALKVLEGEIILSDNPATSPAYRKQLALAEFYKGLLTLCPDGQIADQYKSGTIKLHESRPVSKGSQEFETDPSIYPLNQPIPKVEGLIQCAGEAPYTDDVPGVPDELFCDFVTSTVSLGTISSIDPSEALAMPGVVAFYTAKDIPGTNSFILKGLLGWIADEEVFCSGEVKFYSQPIGLIVAESEAIAKRAAKKVKVTYTHVKKPLLDVKVAKDDSTRTTLLAPIPNIGRGLFVKKSFQSNYTIRAQMHFCMENIACVVRPTEFGLAVHSGTHWMDAVQGKVAEALKIDVNRVDVITRRVGGSFGLKVTRATMPAIACSLAAYKPNRQVRLVQSFSSIARIFGKRLPCSTDVDVKVGSNGKIQYMKYQLYSDNGYKVSELVAILGVDAHSNCYNRLWWDYLVYNSTTDTAKNTFFRAPSTLENIAMTETVMEQISYELSLDPYDVRMANLDSLLHSDIKTMGETLKTKADYDLRKAAVHKFNSENRWKKRGLRWAFMRYTAISPAGYEVSLSVSHVDGTVTINHAGIELGQGINTKAIQICAHLLGLPIDSIKVKPQNTITEPNSILTSSSLTSQSIGMGVEACCKELLRRLVPIRILLLNPSWPDLIKRAHTMKVDLQTRTYVNDILSPIFNVYGVTLSEVEVDILTGESVVLRVDLYEDAGRSVSPQIDIGQVEGAFITGLSYWMLEEMVYDESTGEVLSDRPWNYHIAQCRDIPQDFRVSFRKNSYSSDAVFGAKVTGEPAICMAVSIPFAMREALSSARQDSGIPTTEWFTIDGPWTSEKVCMAAATKLEDFKFN